VFRPAIADALPNIIALLGNRELFIRRTGIRVLAMLLENGEDS
jgi:hypothetical protein